MHRLINLWYFDVLMAAMARSFLQVASTEEVAPPLRVVQIEGLVVSLSLHALFRFVFFFLLLCGFLSVYAIFCALKFKLFFLIS